MTIKSYFLKQIQLIASWLLVKSQLAFDNDNIRQLNSKNPSRAVNELALKKDRFLKGCRVIKCKSGYRAVTYQISPLVSFDVDENLKSVQEHQEKGDYEIQDTVILLRQK